MVMLVAKAARIASYRSLIVPRWLTGSVIGVARRAFTQAMDWVLIASVATVLITAIVAVVALRRVSAGAGCGAGTALDDEAA
jgi:hypothetical protein